MVIFPFCFSVITLRFYLFKYQSGLRSQVCCTLTSRSPHSGVGVGVQMGTEPGCCSQIQLPNAPPIPGDTCLTLLTCISCHQNKSPERQDSPGTQHKAQHTGETMSEWMRCTTS